MIWEIAHWLLLASAAGLASLYFRDLGDVTQIIFDVKRRNVMRAIRHERAMIAASLLTFAGALGIHVWQETGVALLVWIVAFALLVMLGLPWLWLHVGLRDQQDRATHYSIQEAKQHVRPEDSVIVIENNGEAQAYPDHQIKRPHLASRPKGLGGEDVMMSYCAMTHLGLAYKPVIDGKKLDLEVIAQHGNNLIMRDKVTGEPIQQVYGTRERDGRGGVGMAPWPTFRMSFRAFEQAFPDGEVFLNKIKTFRENPLLCVFDNIVEAIFLWAVTSHHNSHTLLFETLDHEDDRLPRKELIWGFTVNGEPVAYTEEFVRGEGNVVNAEVGGRRVVIAYDPNYESLGVYYNEGALPVHKIDFWGNSDRGRLKRVETLQAGAYWCVWANFFPETDLNRTDSVRLSEAA